MKIFSDTELMLNSDGSIFHLHLLPFHIADEIILVGDPARVQMIANYFSEIELKKVNREFYTITGIYKNKRITVISTGIGTDNIDIVINEIDAIVNIDLKERKEKEDHKQLNFYRIGTCGLIQENIHLSSYIVSDYCIGFDNLMTFYQCRYENDEIVLKHQIENHFIENRCSIPFYIFKGSEQLRTFFDNGFFHGITVATPGFYGPQDRFLRLKPKYHEMLKTLATFEYNELKILNFEMETSAIYGLSSLLGHKAITIDLALGNRLSASVDLNYKWKMEELVIKVLDIISSQ